MSNTAKRELTIQLKPVVSTYLLPEDCQLNLLFQQTSSSDSEITKGSVGIDVSYFGFHVHQETHDICEETSCPVSGDFVLAHEHTLPVYTPPGSYTLTMNMAGADGKQLTCITFGFSIGFIADN